MLPFKACAPFDSLLLPDKKVLESHYTFQNTQFYEAPHSQLCHAASYSYGGSYEATGKPIYKQDICIRAASCGPGEDSYGNEQGGGGRREGPGGRGQRARKAKEGVAKRKTQGGRGVKGGAMGEGVRGGVGGVTGNEARGASKGGVSRSEGPGARVQGGWTRGEGPGVGTRKEGPG